MPDNDNSQGCQSKLNRRKLLRLAGASTSLTIICGGAAGCGNPTGTPPTGPVSGGNISGLAVGSLHVMSNVALGRDDGGIYAMSAVCTHAGCLLTDANHTVAGGLDCPCHESLFDGQGAVTHGPAREALQHYQVTIASDGSITVDGSQPVAAGARTAAVL